MSNADVVLTAKDVFSEDLEELWEVWDEKPKWISAKELYQEDVQDFWDSWEETPQLTRELPRKEKSPQRNDEDEEEEAEEDTSESDYSSTEDEDESESSEVNEDNTNISNIPKSGLISAKAFFKDDECWWNDTVEDLDKPKVINAKEMFSENENWWEKEDSEEETDSDEDDEEEESEGSEVQFPHQKGVPAKEFFREDECWWRDAEEELKKPKGVCAKEYFKEDQPWWVKEDENEYSTNKAIPAKEVFKEDAPWWVKEDENEFSTNKAIPAKEIFKENTAWWENSSDDKNDSPDDCDEAYESIISDTSTMFSASEGTNSSYQECDWWLSSENSEVSNSVVKAKDLFKEEAWWDENSEGTDTPENESSHSNSSKQSLSENGLEYSDDETQAESIIEEEHGLNDIDRCEPSEEDDLCDEKSLNEIQQTEQKFDVKSLNKFPNNNIKDLDSTNVQFTHSRPGDDGNPSKYSNEKSESFSPNEQSSCRKSKLVSEYVTETIRQPHNAENQVFIQNPLYNVEGKRFNKMDYSLDPNEMISEEPNNDTTFPDLKDFKAVEESEHGGHSQSAEDKRAETSSYLSSSDTYEKVVNKMDKCLAELDERIALVDIQLKGASEASSKDSVSIKRPVDASTTKKVNTGEEEKASSRVREKFDVIRVNVSLGNQKSILVSDEILNTMKAIPQKDPGPPMKREMDANLFDELVNSLIDDQDTPKLNCQSRLDPKLDAVESTADSSSRISSFTGSKDQFIADPSKKKYHDLEEPNTACPSKTSNDSSAIKTDSINFNASQEDAPNEISDDSTASRFSKAPLQRAQSTQISSEDGESPNFEDLSSEPSMDRISSNLISSSTEKVNASLPDVCCSTGNSGQTSRENSVEIDNSRNASPTLILNRGIWRCSTYDEITISQYDRFASKLARSQDLSQKQEGLLRLSNDDLKTGDKATSEEKISTEKLDSTCNANQVELNNEMGLKTEADSSTVNCSTSFSDQETPKSSKNTSPTVTEKHFSSVPCSVASKGRSHSSSTADNDLRSSSLHDTNRKNNQANIVFPSHVGHSSGTRPLSGLSCQSQPVKKSPRQEKLRKSSSCSLS